jgi:hypothetical protein
MEMRAFWCALGVLAAQTGCGSSSDTKDTVPARPGFQMPEGGSARLGEAEACTELSQALSGSAQRLGCSAAPVSCPSYVRPAGGEGCFEYDDASVKACVNAVKGYTRCTDFETKRCIVSAIRVAGQCLDRPPDASADDAGDDDGESDDGAGDAVPASDAAEDALADAAGD